MSAPEMGSHVVLVSDKNGLRQINYDTGHSWSIVASRGVIEPDTFIDMVPIQTLINVLRKAGIWVVQTKINEPGG